ncbi:MAG TPA: glycosyltransferase family 87 protein [Terriglobales bacterium]|nr:glycosyltransferase family 87 protein [Terriglobales bacterium]
MALAASPMAVSGEGKRVSLESLLVRFAFAVLLVSALLWADRPPTMEKTDFSVTYIGSRMVHLGMGPKVYDLDEQRKLKQELLPDAEPLLFEHPPFEAFLLSPLGALPYKWAYLVWGLMNSVVWLTLPFLLRPYAPLPTDELGYLVLWLLFAPLGVALFQGQSSLFILLFYALAFLDLKRGHDFRAGALFGLALMKFQFAVPFALILLLARKRQFIKGFLLTGAALLAISFYAVGWDGIVSYIHLLTNISRHPDNASYGSAIGMATLQGLIHATLGEILAKSVVTVIVLGLSLGLIGWIAWQWRKLGRATQEPAFDLVFSAAVVVSLVTGFHMFTHDLSPMMLAMLLVLAHFSRRHQTWLRWTLAASLCLFWIPPLFFLLLAKHSSYLWVPVLLLFVWAIVKDAENAGGCLPEQSY